MNAAAALAMGRKRQREQSEDERIASLPRWSLASVPDLTERFRTPTGAQALRPIQSAALHAIGEGRGLLAPIGVGHGKGLITMLAGTAAGAKRPLLLIPPPMREPFARELRKFRPHWRVHPGLRVMSYSELSVASGADALERIAPDLIICDEAHNLRHKDATRTRRLLRYMQAHPEVRFVALSGTLTRRGVADYAHLAELALRDGSPLPRGFRELEAWGAILDADRGKKAPPTEVDWWHMRALVGHRREVDFARETYRERLVSTPGVVATDEASVGASLQFTELPLEVPPVVSAALSELERTWTRPDGEELESPLALHRVATQMSAGFFYRWEWGPRGPDWEWLTTRAAWHRELRRLVAMDRPGMDSPLLCTLAVSRGQLADPEALQAWRAWDPHRSKRWQGQPTPPTVPVWLDGFLVDAAAAWACERLDDGEPSIIWYSELAVEQALREYGFPVFGAGTELPADASRHPLICCSVRAHGTGKNLQAWSRNLVLSWPTSGADVEQLIGRTHRAGQEADVVRVDYLAHTRAAREAIVKSRADAEYLEATQGLPQRILYGTWDRPVE